MKVYYSEKKEGHDIKNGILLLPDNYNKPYPNLWDDFNYETTFIMFMINDYSYTDFGVVKILFKESNTSHKFIEKNSDKINDQLFLLNNLLEKEPFISLGVDIDYYNKLNKYLNYQKTSEYLEQLNDAGYLKTDSQDFIKWDGFSSSLLRDSSSQACFENGYAIAIGAYKPKNEFEIAIKIKDQTQLKFHFVKNDYLNGNINILIGKNGTGKTQALKKISNLFTGIEQQDEKWPYFNKLLIVAFSPFEDFYTKKDLIKKLGNKKNGKKNRTTFINEYSYIGLKSESNSLDLININRKSVFSILDSLLYDKENKWWTELLKFELIKKTLLQAMEFDQIALKLLNGNYIYGKELTEKSYSDEPRKDIDSDYGLVFLDKDKKEMPLSSGQKIYSYMIPNIINEIKDSSLLLIDEPELYLHPELEVGLISMLNLILKETDSFAIIATHSSIITREIKRDYVNIFKSNNKIIKPEYETFGESLDKITGSVFDDYNTQKLYQKELMNFVDKCDDINEAIDILSPKIGDEALTYLLNLKNNDINEEEITFKEL
ncbi:AAA family ATPase [Photobacterium carnosum]|uniref:AAA family ATPase n=1 Tax=Photobacterium carnosum TaxID=2023717 RepID=UPI001C90F7CA|nr:AAA family ATPase [Photobacterium carnosum]MBY3789896.1 AAA family ATPase [Photobacterium carnosum]MCD9534951.1 AAA family ATPase [Photobacterium carnosum]